MTDVHPDIDNNTISEKQRDLLLRWAGRYIWWKTPDEALRYPQRILAQVMNIGDYADVQEMVEAFGNNTLCAVIRQAEIGQFNDRSWAYWHYRLGLASPEQVPPQPTRKVAD
jgi:hypothetical protein